MNELPAMTAANIIDDAIAAKKLEQESQREALRKRAGDPEKIFPNNRDERRKRIEFQVRTLSSLESQEHYVEVKDWNREIERKKREKKEKRILAR